MNMVSRVGLLLGASSAPPVCCVRACECVWEGGVGVPAAVFCVCSAAFTSGLSYTLAASSRYEQLGLLAWPGLPRCTTTLTSARVSCVCLCWLTQPCRLCSCCTMCVFVQPKHALHKCVADQCILLRSGAPVAKRGVGAAAHGSSHKSSACLLQNQCLLVTSPMHPTTMDRA